MQRIKPIVTDTYDFPTLVGEGYVYVDKTALLRRMISGVDGRFGFKYGKTAKAAIRQIDAKDYAKPYASDARATVVVGVDYSPRARAVEVECGTVNGTVKPDCGTVNGTVRSERIFAILKNCPGVRRPELQKLTGWSARTVARAISELSGRIEFRGAPKTGGYYILGKP